MKRIAVILQWVLIALLILSFSTLSAKAVSTEKDSGYQTGFQLWRGTDGGFTGWTLNGTRLDDLRSPNGVSLGPVLALDPTTAQSAADPYPPGGYSGHNFYNGGSFLVGEATSPILETGFAFKEAIASWNADTPDGAWMETLVSARVGGRWTKWYNLGVWASGTDTVERHSVSGQGDADGYVATDTLVLAKSKLSADALQLKVRLFSATGSSSPTVRSLSLAFSTSAVKKVLPSAGNPADWNTLIDVPLCSQMVYPDGGNVWCSPTSVSMVLGKWGFMTGPCEPRVRATVAGVYDWLYDGHGNWPFNTAYAASLGMEGYVERFTSLTALEPWIKAGVPVVMSIAWSKSELDGAPVSSSSGHLIVLVGFDASGNPIVNDPAAADDAGVRLTYNRQQLEAVWLANSGGTVYLIFPPGHQIPEL